MTRATTIRVAEETLKRLESLARATGRSPNFLANQAFKEYVERHEAPANAIPTGVPAAERLEDYQSSFWKEDDCEVFAAYLDESRKRSASGKKLVICAR